MHQTTQSTLELQLLSSYGPLLTLKQLASLLHRSPAGLSYSLARPGQLTEKLRHARVKLGKRVYYRSTDVATALAGATDEV